MDRVVRTTRKSWFSRIASSFMGVLFGIIMFFASFAVLYHNEGRVNLSKVAKEAIVFDADENAPTDAEGLLVAASGQLLTDEKIGDEYVRQDHYLKLERIVEMYAWKEDSRSKERKNIGGSSKTTTTYTYRRAWQTEPENSNNFEEPRGHYNPPMNIESQEFQPQEAKIGGYSLDGQDITMPKTTPLMLRSNVVDLEGNISRAGEEYLFMGEGSLKKPIVGDIRISYKVVKSPVRNATVLGQLEGDEIRNFTGPRESTLYRAFNGSFQESVKILRQEHNTTTWILRVLGFCLMWFGTMLIFNPISTFLDLIPLTGRLTRGVIAFASFLVCLILTVVTIIVSAILHNFWLMVGVVIATIIALIIFARMRKRAKDRM